MNRIYQSAKLCVCFFLSILLLHGCRAELDKTEYLKKVLNNLEQIRSAEYFSAMTGNPPGDTITFNTYYHYKKEFVNPADTFIGSAYIWLNNDDTSKMYLCYDGNASIYVYDKSKIVTVDSFKMSTNLPFRPVGEPFFHQSGSLIKYALDTDDSVTTDLTDFGDSVRLSLFIPGKIITFHGKPYTYDSPYLSEKEKYTKYELWINRQDDMPYRMVLKLSYGTSIETCSHVVYNKSRIEDLSPAKYFPSDYVVKERGKNQPVAKDLTGKKAPAWTLRDSENNLVSLQDFRSKVLLIEFTGIGCAPCHSAIPFLKQLVTDYEGRDFELVSIETWSQKVDASKRYKDSNQLNYTFLASTDSVKKSYNAEAVPAFFILDNDRVIRKIIRGYSKGTTDREIREAIDGLLE